MLTALLASQKAVDKPDCPLMPDKSRCESAPAGVVVMRVGVRDSLVRWVDEKPWRFKLILLLHTAVVGVIELAILAWPRSGHIRVSECSGARDAQRNG